MSEPYYIVTLMRRNEQAEYKKLQDKYYKAIIWRTKCTHYKNSIQRARLTETNLVIGTLFSEGYNKRWHDNAIVSAYCDGQGGVN